MDVRLVDADGFDRHAGEAEFAILQFSREEVAAQRIGSAVERLMLFSDDAKHVRHFAGRMAFAFAGYDEDSRPVVQIPECVRYFRAVDRQWNYWLHFLRPDPEVLNLAMLLLLDVEAVAAGAGRIGYALREPKQLPRLLERWFRAMNVLHDAFGVPPSHNETMSAAVLAAIGGR
jgi:hypothetical protein